MGSNGTSPIYLDDGCQHDAPESIRTIPRKNARLIAFPWYGGKNANLKWLLSKLPRCRHYCEPFGGSAAVLLNREPSPVETYNDIYGDVVHFFRVLRDKPEELVRAIALTPVSREEFFISIYGATDGVSDIERARRFYVRVRQSYNAKQRLSLGDWAYNIEASCRLMARLCSSWIHSAPQLLAVAERLRRVQIENRPAVDVIRLYDTPDTLFYCDPPYPLVARPGGAAYQFEMSLDEHRELAAVLNSCKGMVAVSGYDHPLMDELFNPKRWHKTFGPQKPSSSSQVRSLRQDVLWTNYDPREGCPELFGSCTLATEAERPD